MTAVPALRLRADRLGPAFGLGLAAGVASAATVDKYVGIGACVVYLVALAAGAPYLLSLLAVVRERLTEPHALLLALATLAALIALFALVYPHANSQTIGSGSDRDDAADIGARALLHGHFPYSEHTYLGNSISQFPGGLLLAMPFVALGHSAYAAFVWLPLFFLLQRALSGEARSPLLLTWAALAVSPVFVRELVTGGDLIANSVAVMVAAWLIVAAFGRSQAWAVTAAALGLGVALSWRLNFVFVLAPLLALLRREHGLRWTAGVAALGAGAFAAVTLPFYLGHRREFTPIAASDKLTGFNGTIPGGARAVIAIGLCLSVALALVRRPEGVRHVFAQTAIVQAFFVVAVVVLASADQGEVVLSPLVPGYGLPVLLLALGALASPLPALRPRLVGAAAGP
jgi:hypothetical protein